MRLAKKSPVDTFDLSQCPRIRLGCELAVEGAIFPIGVKLTASGDWSFVGVSEASFSSGASVFFESGLGSSVYNDFGCDALGVKGTGEVFLATENCMGEIGDLAVNRLGPRGV